MAARIVESESVESHVFSWSRESVESHVFSWSRESVESHVFSWSRESESFFKIAGVGVGFSKMLESESGVGVGFLKMLESESVFQMLESESGVGILKNLPTPQPWCKGQ